MSTGANYLSDQTTTSVDNTGVSALTNSDQIFRNRRNRNIFFIFILLLNLLVKSHGIGINSLDYDESISLKNVSLDFGHVKHEAEWDNNPPFYYYCIWVWHHIFEITEVNARILSLIFSSLAIALFAGFVLKRVNFISASAIALMLTAHTMLLFHAQQARSYSLTLLLVVISTITFFNYIEKRKLTYVLLLGLINFLLVYTHYVAGIIPVIQGCLLLSFERKLLPKYLWTYLIVVVLVSIRFTKKQFLTILGYNSTGDFWLKKPGNWDLNEALYSLCNNSIVKWIFIIACLVLVIRFILKPKEISSGNLVVYSLLTSFFTIFLLFMISQFKAIFLARYLIFCVPFIYLSIALAIRELLPEKYRTPAILIVALCSILTYQFTFIRNEDYRVFANTVKAIKQKDDVVIINTADDTHLFTYYFDKALFLKKNFSEELSGQNVFAINTPEEIKNYESYFNNRIILIQQFQNTKQGMNAVQYLSQQYEPYFHAGDTNKVSLVFLRKIPKK